MEFFLDDWPIGQVGDAHASVVPQVLPTAHRDGGVLRWRPGSDDVDERSRQIQRAAEALCASGLIGGWRGELYRCEQPVLDPCRTFGDELFRLERAAFRFFGLMSRAVHVNGLLADGRIWCARRAASKAIDPGRLDSLAAGGLGAGEDLCGCARRELFEEAGVPTALAEGLQPRGAVRTRRVEPEGWHDEVLHVYELTLPEGFVPANQDGEVSEFLLLDRSTLRQRLAEMTADAAAALHQSVVL